MLSLMQKKLLYLNFSRTHEKPSNNILIDTYVRVSCRLIKSAYRYDMRSDLTVKQRKDFIFVTLNAFCLIIYL